MTMISLRGITWNHSRGLTPLAATAQRFEELHPGTRIQWEKRTLHEFGHADLATLAREFDLLVIDHPMMGDAEASGVLVDLLSLAPSAELDAMRADSAGASFSSYLWNGKLYALPIDAAAPAAFFRPDLLARDGISEPDTWAEVVALARRGWVRMPGFPADLFLNFMALCVSRDGKVPCSPDRLFDRQVGLECLNLLRELAGSMPEGICEMNPIAVHEQMSREDTFAYCPFAYTYSNYSRSGYAKYRLRFANPPRLEGGARIRTVLGGTGLAISTKCASIPVALEYALEVAGSVWQRTLYGVCGGQPARKSAWLDPALNQLADNFFSRTLASLEAAYIRPRYRGYTRLQELAGLPIQDYCRGRIPAELALDQVEALYLASLKEAGNSIRA